MRALGDRLSGRRRHAAARADGVRLRRPLGQGNLTLQRSWDSTRGPLLGTAQDLVRLGDGNSVGVRREYDDNTADPALRFGNLTLAVDADGNRTKYTYGAVTAPGGATFNGLYPTTVVTAEGTGVHRTASSVYDFSTGLVTRATDVENVVSTTTAYDDLGRPTLVKAAEGLPEESRTATEYDDAARRVVVRADKETAGDGKLVTVQHYDRLGRVRLTRTLEDASTQSAADEAAGLKVQTRYAYGAQVSYQLVSNPYRAAAADGAAAEGSMGWTVTTADRGGRVVRVETFGGAGLPAPFVAVNPNASSTGAVVTAYDAEKVTVTDQAGRKRRSVSDALGRLVRVDEPDKDSGALDDSVGSPLQQTAYAYDALGNLRRVDQGGQQRFFLYDSLSRLIRAKNPEQGAMAADADFPAMTDPAFGNPGGQWSTGYLYDAAGNLRKRKDARGVTTTYGYDALNRNTTVHYETAGSGAAFTPDVTRSYDGATRGKGRPWKTETAQTALVTVAEYDAMGRPLRQGQQFWAGAAWGTSYDFGYGYDLAGGLKTQSYPSLRSVSYTYDGAGRLSGFTGNLGGGAARTYADTFAYDAENRMTSAEFFAGQAQTASYVYDADGRRVKRMAGTSAEAWQVYGAGGELLAEYAPNAAPNQPAKEYGYRGGELLVTAEAGAGQRRVNVARASSGATATASSTYTAAGSFPAAGAIDGDHVGANWGTGGGWNDSTADTYPDWLQVSFSGAKTIGEVDLYTLQDAPGNAASEPTESMTFTQYGIVNFDVQYWTGSQWAAVPGGSVTGNNKVWRKVTFPAVTTTKVRVVVNAALDVYSRLVEVEAWGGAAAGADVRWLVADQLGTPRMVVDKTGSLAGVTRHDYLPFGEELSAGVGGRTTTQGYGAADNLRQQFTGKEFDGETGLTYFLARYCSTSQGRFTGIDPGPFNIADPQSWNRYSYVQDNPLKFIS